MSVRRRIRAVILATVAVLALSGCAGLPMSGPVNRGNDVNEDAGAPDFSLVPDRPQPGASPEQIVEGFLKAGSGPTGNWEIARMFLDDSIRSSWKPEAGVIIDEQGGERVYSATGQDALTVSIVGIATIDENGAYEPASAPAQLPFELAQDDDGEWRITRANDGIVLDSALFTSVYHRYSLMYFDQSRTYLVPDVRWFPATYAATRITTELVEGAPSPWLAASVVTAFPESVTLVSRSVPVPGGTAQVELSSAALALEPETLDLMQTQLTESLATASVAEVEMTVAASPLDADVVSTRSTRITGAPLVESEGQLGFFSGSELTPIPGLSDTMTTVSPTAIQVSPDRDYAATLVEGGDVVRVEADGDVAVLDQRDSLISPTTDPLGFIWSVPRGDPSALRAYSSDGVPFDVAEAWANASDISAMAISRDGSRMLAVVVSGGRDVMWVAGVVRDRDGAPVRLGEPLELGVLPGEGVSAAWLDEATVGAVVRDGGESVVIEQVVGGGATSSAAPEGAVAIAASASIASARLRAVDGTLYVRRGTTWLESTTGIDVLATQQGSPQ